MSAPDAAILDDAPPGDPVARVCKVSEAFNDEIEANEVALRLILARTQTPL